MNAHTPGPWKAETLSDHDGPPQCDEFQVQALIGATWMCIADCDWSDRRKELPTRQQAEANARLMAAAPELLAAARKAVCALAVDDLHIPEYEALDAAIAKAMGRAA